MDKNIKFSVTVPAYKSQFLKECIDSILAQTYTNFELIIVNDNSPQDLDTIVSQYHDVRIRYYKNKVGFGAENVVGNWNKCLEYATGGFIICMGDDDKLLPNCLEDYVKLIEIYPTLNLYHTMTEIIDANSEIFNIQESRPERESMLAMLWGRLNGRIQYIGDWLFRVSKLRENGGFYFLPYAWSSDFLSSIIASEEGGVANTTKPGFQYRRSRITISSSSKNAPGKVIATDKAYHKICEIIDSDAYEELDKIYYKLIREVIANKFDIDKSQYMSSSIHHFLFLSKGVKQKWHITNKTILRALHYKLSSFLHNLIHTWLFL